MGKDKNKDKEQQDGETAASAESITSSWNTHQSNRDCNQDREARDTALAKTITKAVIREMAMAHTFTIGSMEREWDILSHGKTTKPSFSSLSMMD